MVKFIDNFESSKIKDNLSYQDKDSNGGVNTAEIVQENNYYALE
jgi:hypothetical protein